MSITFDVNKKALQSMGQKMNGKVNSVVAGLNTRTKSTVEAAGGNHSDLVESTYSHGLLDAMHMSFDRHYPLIITPDVIWLTIAQGFANHVNQNAEQLRKRFVDHEGKKMLLIQRDSFVKGSPNNDWPGCFSEFSDKIGDHIGKKRDLLVSNFSTTSPIEKAASELVLMDSMKSYFKYAVRTLCGIPRITLTGTENDWFDIRVRAENLAEYDLDWWIKPLLPVLDELVKTAEGNPNIEFWDSFYKKSSGSGGDHITGWVNTLFPYAMNYKEELVKNENNLNWKSDRSWGMGMDNYPSSLSKVPFKWELDGAITHDMEFLGGIVGVHQDSTTLAVEPTIGWGVRDKGTSQAGPIDESQDW